MSGIYANNVAARMPITWQPHGVVTERKRGECYAVEGDAQHGFIMLVITDKNEIQEVSITSQDVRLDTEAIEKAKSSIEVPPSGTILRPEGQ